VSAAAAWRRRAGLRSLTSVAAVSPIGSAEALGDLAHRGSGEDEQAVQHDQDQQRHGDPGGDALGEESASEEAELATAVHPAAVGGRFARGKVQHAEQGEEEQEQTDDQPGPGVRTGFGAHQHDAGKQQIHRKADGAGADGGAHAHVDPVPDRSGRVPPDPTGADHGQRDQDQGEAVPAVCRVEFLGPADGPCDPPDALGQQAPGAGAATRSGPFRPRPGR
jgi:hypothetical protein